MIIAISYPKTAIRQRTVFRRCKQLEDIDSVKRLEIKDRLEEKLTGMNRGIFGMKARSGIICFSAKTLLQAAVKGEILDLLSDLESITEVVAPTEQLGIVSGDWKLLFSTITITGSKRTKLGLRQLVELGDFIQSIDVERSIATNLVTFSVMGLGALNGSLKISASFTPTSRKRVEISLMEAFLEPEALQKLFEENFDLLLQVFNPAGWLDITYVDDTHRIGRDDKQNIFYLQRVV